MTQAPISKIMRTIPNSKGRSMNRRLSSTLISAAMIATPLALVPATGALHAQSMTSPARTVTISIGRGELVTVPGRMADVFVADDKVADVQVKSTNQLYVFGKSGGETTVYASNAKGDVVWSANVRVGNNIDSIDQMLHLAMPEARVNVSTMNNTVLLTGTVGAPEDAAEAERLVKAFVGDKTNVISRLKMATPLQVSLHVKFAEVSRTLVRQIGVNLTTIDGSGGIKFGIGQGRAIGSTFNTHPQLPLAVGAGDISVNGYILDPTGATQNFVKTPGTAVSSLASGTTLSGMGKLLGLDLLGALDAGETIGLVTTLSEPNLTALSGETADFLAGGEYPIPVSQGLGTTSIEYKKYGVSLAYTPTVLANGRISIRVRPEVSELSSTGALKLDNIEIPALTVRRAETTVELGSGQSFMIAGLLQNGAQNQLSKMPGAGDIPILGSLFRSTSYKKGETELVIVVTPYLVNPVNANDITLPTDGFQSPNDIQRLLGNMENDGVTGGDRPKPTEKEGTVQAGPKVGALEAPASANQPADRRSDKKVAAVAPGFSIQ
ncbi:type II and III secretion system protein family protein [Novosphingobium taihuense]|uniref:Pilus assembly protein CpaC n=1 Tax=Novosphingobium taihuense TaxID=260085 RepID=A0A7W7AE99_9SPHN|nr:type II and III secretion system protein family protein [Novosphingobium taihuense]MBB4615306.1 pilus assembly protein CpaC [Novosphingobium taihuense]TWH84341.1 pilus assembly protein CpaC [Novosphingobium taihuense]